jgi:hypothetical protein
MLKNRALDQLEFAVWKFTEESCFGDSCDFRSAAEALPSSFLQIANFKVDLNPSERDELLFYQQVLHSRFDPFEEFGECNWLQLQRTQNGGVSLHVKRINVFASPWL